VTALKKAEADGAVVLRVFETDGAKAETPIEFLGRKGAFRAANLLEEETRLAEERTLRVRPYEISTVRLVPK
jgi:alpha-mannosidase